MADDDVGASQPVYEKTGGGNKRPRERLLKILAETDDDKPLEIPRELAPWVRDWRSHQPTPKVVRRILALRRCPKPANIHYDHVAKEMKRLEDDQVSKRMVQWVCDVFEDTPPRERVVRLRS